MPASSFAAAFTTQIAGEDKSALGRDGLAALAARHETLAQKHQAGKPLIAVTVPPLAGRSWSQGQTLIDIVSDDRPFLVDSIASEMARQGRTIQMLIHPIMDHLSHIHMVLQGTTTPEGQKSLHGGLETVLRDVKAATGDWEAMRKALLHAQEVLKKTPARLTTPEDIAEGCDFLSYLYQDNFTLLGYAYYNGKGQISGESRGLLDARLKPPFLGTQAREDLPPGLFGKNDELGPLVITKLGRRSTVHRPVPLDAVAVRALDDKGGVKGVLVFIGLFTSVTYSRSITDIPVLRRKADQVLAAFDARPGSHDYKALRHILEKYPRDELFQIKLSRLEKIIRSILVLQERRRIALYNRKDTFDRFISCLVYVPRERYDSQLRATFQDILEKDLRGTCSNFYTTLDDSPLARVMYVIDIDPANPPQYSTAPIEKRLQDAGAVWSEKLAEALLVKLADGEKVAGLLTRYGNAFPSGYQDHYEARQAWHDIGKIEQTLKGDRFSLDLYKDHTCGPRQVRLKIFHKGEPITLSDALPILENMGLRTISELPFSVRPAGACAPVWIHDFLMEIKNPAFPDFNKSTTETKLRFEEDFIRLWYGEAENDTLNQLVLGAGLDWRAIVVLRAYVRYLRQTANPFGKMYMESALTRHPAIAQLFINLFAARFDPARSNKRDEKIGTINAAIEKAMEKVESLDDDRILRSMHGLVNATLRTNFYQRDEQGQPKSWLSMKFDSRQINDLPDPKPFREIFVYSPRVEAVHLRSDWIARGGIRWSDRHEDFRTEILGLMKTQQVKNAVIVPMGAKGGFIVKRPPAAGGRAAYQQEGVECYKIFIRGLLDITDNRKGKAVTRPKDVVCHDEPDPYLVVAADKGTATFSDTANALSLEYGHWLGDAFASGGSAGYDHKKMGITARGAWESVKRHFREIGKDIQKEEFSVIGVGDMAGDVFGNGMLLSPHIKLVAAFNHVHIFLDPQPDTAVSFKERERLFREVKGWDGYNEKLLSKGGRIYNRSEKSLALTPEIKKLLNIGKDKISPPELIQALLRQPIDLLWFGGIGTYVKASAETPIDVGDKANDGLRVDATEIRARVIGEGANLALTQKARVELGRLGVRLNADFIDNSGGVDSSDHEVNIKILMTDIMGQPEHKMDLKKRNALLASMTDEVAGLVLRHNYQQTQGISLMEAQAAEMIGAHRRFIVDLEREAGLDRKLENLPDDENFSRLQHEGKGLTRPELSIVQAYAKIRFTRDLLASDLPDHKALAPWLINYFPAPLRKTYRAEILNHRLRREIVATNLSFQLVNRMGPTFVQKMMNKTGATAADVAMAWLVMSESFNLPALWAEIEMLDGKVPGAAQIRAMLEINRMAERETAWFLTKLGRKPDLEKDVKAFRDSIATLEQNLEDVLTPTRIAEAAARRKNYVADGLPPGLAQKAAVVTLLGASCDIIRISLERKTDLLLSARIYFSLGEKLHFNWLREEARKLKKLDHQATEALESLIDHIYSAQSGLTVVILREKGKSAREKIVDEWLAAPGSEGARSLERFLADIHNKGVLDLPTLVIVEQRLRALLGG